MTKNRKNIHRLYWILSSLSVILFLIFVNSDFILSKLYGVEKITSFDKKRYEKFVLNIKNRIDCKSVISDVVQYKQVINLGKDSIQKNNLGQPVKILYFENNELKSFQANCFAEGGITNINWNTDNRFDYFIPKSALNTSNLIFDLEDFSKIYDINSTKKYTIIVFWTFMLEKISFSAIEIMISNLKRNNVIDKVDVYLINSDKYFLEVLKK